MKVFLFKETHKQVSIGWGYAGVYDGSLNLQIMLRIEAEVVVSWISNERRV